MQGKCPCNSNSLALSAGKLMRIIVHPVIQPHLCQKNLCLYLDGGQDFTFSFFKTPAALRREVFSASITFSRAVYCGNRLKFWNTRPKCSRFLTDHGFLSGCRDRGIKNVFRHFTRIIPLSGCSRKFRQRRSVVFPLPEDPMMETACPFSRLNPTSFKTGVLLKDLLICFYF